MATNSNPFGLSNNLYGSIILLTASITASIVTIMYQVAEEEGLSSGSLALYSSFAQLLGALLIDGYFRYVGYSEHAQWFAFIDIFKEKQWNRFCSIKHFPMWFGLACVLSYVWSILLVASYVFVYDVGDAIAIFDCYPILIPLFGLCIPTGSDWKHRYFICLTFIAFGVMLLTEPTFLFNSAEEIDAKSQTIGCFLAILATFFNALALIATVMLKKLSYFDFCKEKSETQIQIQNEQSPLIEKSDDGFVRSKAEYIVHHDVALTVLLLEYMAVANILLCVIFCPLSTVKSGGDYDWFWDEFILFYSNVTPKAVRYAIGSSILSATGMALFIYGIFKVNSAPLAAIIDISDVLFVYIFSYFWLDIALNANSAMGTTLIILSIAVSLYPWHKHPKIPSSF